MNVQVPTDRDNYQNIFNNLKKKKCSVNHELFVIKTNINYKMYIGS